MNRRPPVHFAWAQASKPAAGPTLLAPAPANPVVEHLYQYGYLASTGALTPKDELLALLRLATEVEHALLVQYLYAAASVSGNPGARRKIINVAVQEMAHFITVQNLLLAVGGPSALHIGRDLLRFNSDFNPLPLNLEPISRLTLAEYVLAEMPAAFPPGKEAVAERVARLRIEVEQQTGLSPHRVGALYAKIYWIFQPSDDPFGPIVLPPDPAIGLEPGWHIQAADFQASDLIRRHQAEPGEWRDSSGPDMRIHVAQDALSAVTAVNSVMEQGEGLGHAEDSHFYEFLETLDLFEAGGLAVKPLPTNPFVGNPALGASAPGSPLQHAYVRLWANLFNIRYTSLLLDIGHAMSTPRTDEDRSILIDLAFDAMMPKLSGLIVQMTSPFMTGLDPHSAPTFELLRENMPASLADCWREQSNLLDMELGIRAELSAHPQLGQDVAGGLLLGDLEASWNDRRAYVDLHLN